MKKILYLYNGEQRYKVGMVNSINGYPIFDLTGQGISTSISVTAENAPITIPFKGATTVATSAAQVTQASKLSKLFKFLSGEWADAAAEAILKRPDGMSLGQAFKNNLNTIAKAGEEAVKTTAKNPGRLAKIGNALSKFCPAFLKSAAAVKAVSFIGRNLTTFLVYGVQGYQIVKAGRKHGSTEAIKEIGKFGITTGCIMASELIASLLTVSFGPLAAPLKFVAPMAGAWIGTWLGGKILGKTADEKILIAETEKRKQELEQISKQNPQIAAAFQQNPQLAQQLINDPKMFETFKKEVVAKNPQQSSQQNPFQQQGIQNRQYQIDQLQKQLAQKRLIPPQDQKQRDAYASLFGNPHQQTSLGSFSNLVYNVDPAFAQMVVNHDMLYNPQQNGFALSQQMNNILAANGYIFG